MKVNSIFDILSLIIISQSVLASKENIRKISQVESWMSTENFTMMIKKSFLYSTCCNIFLSGWSLWKDYIFYFKEIINKL